MPTVEQDQGEAERHVLGKGLNARIEAYLAQHARNEQRRAAARTEAEKAAQLAEKTALDARTGASHADYEQRRAAARTEAGKAAELAATRGAIGKRNSRAVRHNVTSNFEARIKAYLAEHGVVLEETDEVAQLLATPGAPGERNSRDIPQDVKIKVSARDQGKCVQCASTDDLHFDHKIPWSRGGANTVNNIQLLCGRCNRHKGADNIPF
jgi:HNH endonuclease